MDGLLRLWRRPLVYRTAIGLYVTLVVTLAGLIFAVNNLDVQSAIYLRADTQLETDRNHGARGAFHHAPTGEVLVPERMEWSLMPVDETGEAEVRHDIDFLRGSGAESWPTPTFRLPDDLPEGSWDLVVEATHEEVDDLETHHRIDVADRPPPAESFEQLRWPRPQLRNPDARPGGIVDRLGPATDAYLDGAADEFDGADDIELEVAPSTGELVRGLGQKLFLRTFEADSGRPVPATIDLEVTRGMPGPGFESSIRTDSTGIGSTEIRPTTGLELEATVDPEDDQWPPTRFDLDFGAVATQYALRPVSRVVTPGQDIQAAVEGTLPDGTFMADLYDVDGDRFIDGHALKMTDGEGGIRFEAPDSTEHSLLLRIQTYQSLYGTGHAWDSAYVLLLEDDETETLRETTRQLYNWIGDETGSPHHRRLLEDGVVDEASASELRNLLEAGLEEIPRSFQLPPVLMNTRDTDREALDEWREDVKDDLHLMMGIAVFVGIIVVLYFVLALMRRYRRDNAAVRELTIEDADPMSEDQRKSARLERWSVVLQGLIVLLTLIAFAIGILLMVSYL